MIGNFLENEYVQLAAILCSFLSGLAVLIQAISRAATWVAARRSREIVGTVPLSRLLAVIARIADSSIYLLLLVFPCTFWALTFSVMGYGMASDVFSFERDAAHLLIVLGVVFVFFYTLNLRAHFCLATNQEIANQNRNALILLGFLVAASLALVAIQNWWSDEPLPMWFAIFLGFLLFGFARSSWVLEHLDKPPSADRGGRV